MACVFLELGQDVHIDGDLNAAVDEGVRRGYEKAYCANPSRQTRCSGSTPGTIRRHS